MTIAEVSRAYSIPVDTLRYYERIGLLPEGLSGRTVSIGNAAGTGACRILQSAGLAEEARQIAAAAQVVELSVSSFFRKRYIESMNFPPPR